MAPDYGRPLPDILNSKLWKSLEPVRHYIDAQLLLDELAMAYYTYDRVRGMPFDVTKDLGASFTWKLTCQGHAFWSAVDSVSTGDIEYAVEVLEELLDD